MAKLLNTITRDTKVGIYDNCTDVVRVYEDRTVARLAGVKWIGNTGGYHEYKYRIDGAIHNKIVAASADGCDETVFDLVAQAAERQDMSRHY